MCPLRRAKNTEYSSKLTEQSLFYILHGMNGTLATKAALRWTSQAGRPGYHIILVTLGHHSAYLTHPVAYAESGAWRTQWHWKAKQNWYWGDKDIQQDFVGFLSFSWNFLEKQWDDRRYLSFLALFHGLILALSPLPTMTKVLQSHAWHSSTACTQRFCTNLSDSAYAAWAFHVLDESRWSTTGPTV